MKPIPLAISATSRNLPLAITAPITNTEKWPVPKAEKEKKIEGKVLIEFIETKTSELTAPPHAQLDNSEYWLIPSYVIPSDEQDGEFTDFATREDE